MPTQAPAPRLASFDVTTGDLTDWGPNASGAINALAVSDGVVDAGGGFTSVEGQDRDHHAALGAAPTMVFMLIPG